MSGMAIILSIVAIIAAYYAYVRHQRTVTTTAKKGWGIWKYVVAALYLMIVLGLLMSGDMVFMVVGAVILFVVVLLLLAFEKHKQIRVIS